MLCDARAKESSKEVLITLVQHSMRLAAAKASAKAV